MHDSLLTKEFTSRYDAVAGRRRRVLMRRIALTLSLMGVATACVGEVDPNDPFPSEVPDNVELSDNVHMMKLGGTHSIEAGGGAHLNYYGGPVLQNVHVVQLDWTSGVDSPTQLGNFYTAVTDSIYMDWLS